MKTNNLRVLPVWKDGPTLTIADRLHEMALLAQAKPHQFTRFVMVYREQLPNGNGQYRHLCFGCDLDQQVGMFEIGKSLAVQESGA